MDTTPLPRRVLVIGLDPWRVPGDWDPAPISGAVQAGLAQFAEHGVGVEACLFGLDGGDDIPALIAEALQSTEWECVVVGGGLRVGDGDEQLELFEQVINLIRQHAGKAAIAFNSTPGDTFAAAARWIAVS